MEKQNVCARVSQHDLWNVFKHANTNLNYTKQHQQFRPVRAIQDKNDKIVIYQ